ncbi:MAG: YIP1 family protein [Defluviitaleaceae bacterium]|nr:YIP1 family protein [Defluviitaleaceae bacterium]
MTKKIMYALLIIIAFFLLAPVRVGADPSTSFTYVLTQRGFTRSQNAYLPGIALTGLGLNGPQDMFIDRNDNIFIADTGNRRIVVYDSRSGEINWVLEHPSFNSPRGVFVTERGYIYVADAAAMAVFRFSPAGELLETFGRPTEPAFGTTSFNPSKVVVNNRGNMFIVSEGVASGVIQLSNNGNFLGFFTTNRTRLSFLEMIQNLIYTRTQLERVADRVPPTIANIFIDRRGIIYTATGGTFEDAIQKHNAAGVNMIEAFSPGGSVVAVWVDEQGIMYGISVDGIINVYSPDGGLLFLMPAIGRPYGAGLGDDRAGLFHTVSAIATDSRGYIWVLDSHKGFLQSLGPTSYALNTYFALTLFNEGEYEQSRRVWTEVLRLNQMSSLAHSGMGNAYIFDFEYEQALHHFRVAGNRYMYSQAFWEIRNIWLQQYLGTFAAAIAAVFIAVSLFVRFDKRKRVKRAKAFIGKQIKRVPLLYGVLYSFHVARHPVDGYYQIKMQKAGSFAGATILYALLFAAFLYYQAGKGFIFQYQTLAEMDLVSLIFGFFVLLFMFIFGNYLASSILDGDGKMKEIYVVLAYASMPLILALVGVTLITHVFTLNEIVFIWFFLGLGISWTVVNVLLGLTEIHSYFFRETLKSVFATFILMLVSGLILMIFSVMWTQVTQFLLNIGGEIWRNVTRSF